MRYASIGSPAGSPSDQGNSGPTARRRVEDGFTLLEALVALVILALMLTALFETYSGGLSALRGLDQHLKARLLAQSLLAEASVQAATPGAAIGQAGEFAWSVTTSPTPEAWASTPSDSPWRAYHVEIAVTWPPERFVRLDTIRLGKVQ